MITIDAARLHDAVRWAQRGLPAKPSVPIMAGMLLAAGEQGLTVSAWDWDVHAARTVATEGHLDRIVVSGRMFVDLVSKLDGEVTLRMDGQRVLVQAGHRGRDKFRLPVMNADEYPQIPASPDLDGVASDLPAAVVRAAASTSRDPGDPVPARRTVLIKPGDEGYLRVIGTDTYQLHIEDVAWDGGDFDPVTVFAHHLGAVMKELGPKVELGFDANLLTVQDGDRVAIVGLAAVDYFKAESATRTQLGLTVDHVDVERGDLLDAVDKAAMFCDQNAPVILELSQDAITVSAAGEDKGDASPVIDAAYEGPTREIAMPPAFLTSAVAAVAGPAVRMRLYPAGKPFGAVFFEGLPELGGEPDLSRTHFVMSRKHAS